MSKLSKKQEKKRQLRQRERARKDPTALAYHGNKYRTRELVGPLMQTETAILEAYIATGRQLTDHDVRRALVELVEQLRHGAARVAELSSPGAIAYTNNGDLVVHLVRARWEMLATDGDHPGRDNMIGIVRTILASVETRKSVSPQSQSYLQFIEGFLGKLGVQVVRVPASEAIDVPVLDGPEQN